MTDLVVYTKNGCPQCEVTKTFLQGNNIEFKTINVSEDKEALDYVRFELGVMAMPVLVKDEEVLIVGLNEEKLHALVEELK